MNEDTTTLVERLQAVQSELKAPKGQTNKFGNYKYRSAEDILEALKPLLNKQKLALIITDEMVEVSGKVYVKSSAAVIDFMGAQLSVNAYAREAEDKKGMDVEVNRADMSCLGQKPDTTDQADKRQEQAGVDEQPSRAVHQEESQAAPSIAERAEMGGMTSPIGMERDRNFRHAHIVQRRLRNHLKGEFHPCGLKIHATERLGGEPAQAAVEVVNL